MCENYKMKTKSHNRKYSRTPRQYLGVRVKAANKEKVEALCRHKGLSEGRIVDLAIEQLTI